MPVLGLSPTRAPPCEKAPRSGGAPRTRQPPATSDSSPAPAAASRPSLSPSCSSASASRLAASAVRESQFCAHLRLILPHCVARAPPAPIQRACCQHCACKVLQGIYIPSSPIWPAAQEEAATLSTGTSDPAREPTTCWHRWSWPGAPTATTAR